jgi:hypothetical protein
MPEPMLVMPGGGEGLLGDDRSATDDDAGVGEDAAADGELGPEQEAAPVPTTRQPWTDLIPER